MKTVNADLIKKIARGAEVLGSGGGGETQLIELMALQLIENRKTAQVISVEDVPNNALVISVAIMGSNLILKEKIPNGIEALNVLRMLENYFGEKTYAVVPVEGAGVNALTPIVTAMNSGLPVIDADGMGRAFPELQMTTFHINGVSITPMAMSDEKGNTIFIDSVDNNAGEWFARGITRLMGGYSWIALYAMTGKELKKSAIKNTLTKASIIGEILTDNAENEWKIEEICNLFNGTLLGEGKVINVRRMRLRRFYGGEALVSGENKLKIVFQNEFLLAENQEGRFFVPDIITLLDMNTLKPVSTEELRKGLNVYVLGLRSDKKWKTEEGMKTVGPEVFGLDVFE